MSDPSPASPESQPSVIVRREGRAGRITLNRPRALNALAYEMVAPMVDALRAWADDPKVELVILDGAGERGLCAGGDVVSLYHAKKEGTDLARRFWGEEYVLNAMIGSYAKPFVAIQDGIVMGGGIGLSAHASHRVVTERSMLAMPETGIGLIPDVGGTWLLARAPDNTGIYLGLSGARMTAADALFAGFADVCVPVAQLPDLIAALTAVPNARPGDVIASLAQEPPPGDLQARSKEIAHLFGGASVEAILAALARDGDPWANKTIAGLKTKSPTALKVTLAALRAARRLPSLAAALDMEYCIVTRLFEDGEFNEGVRALLVDKDRAPKWRRATLEAVSDADIARLMAPLPVGEGLGLAG